MEFIGTLQKSRFWQLKVVLEKSGIRASCHRGPELLSIPDKVEHCLTREAVCTASLSSEPLGQTKVGLHYKLFIGSYLAKVRTCF